MKRREEKRREEKRREEKRREEKRREEKRREEKRREEKRNPQTYTQQQMADGMNVMELAMTVGYCNKSSNNTRIQRPP